MQLLKPAPLSIVAVTSAMFIALDSRAAQTTISPIIAALSPDDITLLITSWGKVVLLGIAGLGLILSALIAMVFKARKEIRDQLEEGKQHSADNKDAIAEVKESVAQVNALAPTPVATIPAPVNQPVAASQPLKP